MAALEKYGLPLNTDFIVECLNCNEEEGYKQAISLFSKEEKADAIFCVNDEMAIGALSALRHLNLNVPNDVGVVGFSNSTAGRYMNPSLTSIEQSGEEIGKTATEILIQTINNENNIGSTFIQNVIEPILIIRESSNRAI